MPRIRGPQHEIAEGADAGASEQQHDGGPEQAQHGATAEDRGSPQEEAVAGEVAGNFADGRRAVILARVAPTLQARQQCPSRLVGQREDGEPAEAHEGEMDGRGNERRGQHQRDPEPGTERRLDRRDEPTTRPAMVLGRHARHPSREPVSLEEEAQQPSQRQQQRQGQRQVGDGVADEGEGTRADTGAGLQQTPQPSPKLPRHQPGDEIDRCVDHWQQDKEHDQGGGDIELLGNNAQTGRPRYGGPDRHRPGIEPLPPPQAICQPKKGGVRRSYGYRLGPGTGRGTGYGRHIHCGHACRYGCASGPSHN